MVHRFPAVLVALLVIVAQSEDVLKAVSAEAGVLKTVSAEAGEVKEVLKEAKADVKEVSAEAKQAKEVLKETSEEAGEWKAKASSTNLRNPEQMVQQGLVKDAKAESTTASPELPANATLLEKAEALPAAVVKEGEAVVTKGEAVVGEGLSEAKKVNPLFPIILLLGLGGALAFFKRRESAKMRFIDLTGSAPASVPYVSSSSAYIGGDDFLETGSSFRSEAAYESFDLDTQVKSMCG